MRSPRPLPARPDDHDDGPPPESRYQHLDDQAVRASAAALQRRIYSRFPQRSLWEVCGELIALVDEVTEGGGISRRRIRTARALSRLGVLVVLLVFGTAITLAALSIWADPDALGPVDWLPLLETVVNDLVFAGIAIFFLLAVPQRLERAHVLRVVHRLRSLAHVIDMHQLVKVPERLPAARVYTEDAREDELALTRAQMTQYLDYCTEMLSLVGKTAALFAEDTTDADVLDAVEGIEALTSDMARKVWQKIAIIQEQGG
ncbi:hypothetical protein [Kocuria marina]|uniref:hypothetical protein n=1 Tax=Kocuria marina TaxID=223184 RepID=UPI0028AA1972|nr:hypothetical protein [Kocuria sp.]